MTGAAAREFLTWYNRVTSEGVRAQLYPRSGRVAERDALLFLRWCSDEGVDPRRWTLAKHDALKWKRRVPFRQLMAFSKKFMAAFREWGDAKQAEVVLQERVAEQVVEGAGAVRMTLFGEAVKRALQLEPETCVRHTATRYFEQSTWCAPCSMAEVCRC